MKRKPLGMRHSQKMFRRGAGRVQSVNYATMPMRGGIRL